jgi:hypothetical protein
MRRPALILSLAVVLSGCAGLPPGVHNFVPPPITQTVRPPPPAINLFPRKVVTKRVQIKVSVCPTLVPYTMEFQKKALAELSDIKKDMELTKMLKDYLDLRKQIRACHGSK